MVTKHSLYFMMGVTWPQGLTLYYFIVVLCWLYLRNYDIRATNFSKMVVAFIFFRKFSLCIYSDGFIKHYNEIIYNAFDIKIMTLFNQWIVRVTPSLFLDMCEQFDLILCFSIGKIWVVMGCGKQSCIYTIKIIKVVLVCIREFYKFSWKN